EDITKLCEAVPPDLAELIRKYPEIFPDDLPAGLPPSRPEDHRIELEPGAQPTVQRQFRLSQPELEELQQQLDYLLTKGFIRPSTSPYAAPILFTPKKDGGFRMCIDYRALNRITIKSRYPIPRADDLLDQLRGAKFFSKIDLRGVTTKFASPPRIATNRFPNPLRQLRILMTMNGVFRELLDKCVIIYLDDILIYSRSREQHLKDLDAVFTLLHKNRLITKGSKCDFLKQELEFLDVVSTEGVKIDPKKIKTIQEWKPPTNLKELQSFLVSITIVFGGEKAASCIRPTQNRPHVAARTSHLRSRPSIRSHHRRQRHRHRCSSPQDSATGYNSRLRITEAAGRGKKLYSPRQGNAGDRPRVQDLACYLTGADITVRMDHKSLQYLRAQPNLNPRQIRWLDFLESNFHYTITYKRGANNIADALTRPTVHTAAILIAQTNPLLTGLFTHGYKIDPFFRAAIHHSIPQPPGHIFISVVLLAFGCQATIYFVPS
ncbi:hypothetical protein CLOM_g6766, partial [Closterium sp. NIES-68]